MLTVRLRGGLGNQMFQYAMGLAQARRLGVRLQLDIGWYDKHPWRLADGKTLPSRQYGLDLWEGVAQPTARGIAPTILESGPAYDQALVDGIKNGDCLDGYWQAERYFRGIRRELMGIFRPRQPMARRTADLLGAISGEGPGARSFACAAGTSSAPATKSRWKNTIPKLAGGWPKAFRTPIFSYSRTTPSGAGGISRFPTGSP